MKLSILMFCPQFRPMIGGAERQAEKLALALVAAGCQVQIITPRIDLHSPDVEEVNGVRIERFPLIDVSRRYPIHGVALVNIPYIFWQVVRAVWPSIRSASVLHCHIGCLTTAAAALAGRILGISVICKAATAGERGDLGEIEKTGASGYVLAWLARRLIPTWIATTEFVAESLMRTGIQPERIIRIPNGVAISTHKGGTRTRNGIRRFLYLGRLSNNSQRDVGTLLKAFDVLARNHHDIELAIVGGGDLYERTKKETEACFARQRIYVPGFDQPDKWLAWADCFVLPSVSEGLSNALLEAMEAGLPCIANDIPPNREVLDDGRAGMLVPIGDRRALEDAMGALIGTSEVGVLYARKARERVEQHYSMQAVAERYLALYQSLSTGKKKR